jgi:hypothetical protein
MTRRTNRARAECTPRRSPLRAKTPGWNSEHIPADDPFARFADMAQKILVRRVAAANRTHWRKYNEREVQKREARERARLLSQQPVQQPVQMKDATR